MIVKPFSKKKVLISVLSFKWLGSGRYHYFKWETKYQRNIVGACSGCTLPTENIVVKKQLLKSLLKLQGICSLEIIFRV